MREIFTSGSVGGAPGNWCFYPEESIKKDSGSIISLKVLYSCQAILSFPKVKTPFYVARFLGQLFYNIYRELNLSSV